MGHSDAWYRNAHWDAAEEKVFFSRLRRQKGAPKKAQAARIKAAMLEDTRDPVKVRAAVALLTRALRLWKVESDVALCRWQLARCLLILEDEPGALEQFQRALDRERAVPRYLTQRLQHLEREVQHQQEEIAALRQQVKAPSHPSTLAQAVPVVALGLAGLGLNAARCEGPRAFNEALCEAGPQGLGNLLALLEAGLLLMGLVPLAEASIAAIGDVTPVVHEIWGVTGP